MDLEEESLTSVEGGAMFDLTEKLRVTVHFFRHTLTNSVFPSAQFSTRLGQDIDDEDDPPPMADSTTGNLFGFTNTNSISTLNAIQTAVNYDGRIFKADLSGQWNVGKEAIEGIDTINAYRSLPQFMGRANLHMDLPKIIRLSIYGQFFSEFTWGLIQVNNRILKKEIPWGSKACGSETGNGIGR